MWNPDIPQTDRLLATWQEVPDNARSTTRFKVQWELFLRHVVEDEPFPWDLLEGAKGVQLAELGLQQLGASGAGSTCRRSTL